MGKARRVIYIFIGIIIITAFIFELLNATEEGKKTIADRKEALFKAEQEYTKMVAKCPKTATIDAEKQLNYLTKYQLKFRSKEEWKKSIYESEFIRCQFDAKSTAFKEYNRMIGYSDFAETSSTDKTKSEPNEFMVLMVVALNIIVMIWGSISFSLRIDRGRRLNYEMINTVVSRQRFMGIMLAGTTVAAFAAGMTEGPLGIFFIICPMVAAGFAVQMKAMEMEIENKYVAELKLRPLNESIIERETRGNKKNVAMGGSSKKDAKPQNSDTPHTGSDWDDFK